MTRYQKIKTSQYIVLGLIITVIVAVAFLSSAVMRRISFEDQFVIPWAAGRSWLLEAGNPYNSSEITQIAGDAISESPYSANLPDERLFLLPVINLFFYLPFSLLPYTISRIIWVTIMSISIVLIGHFSISLSNWELPPIGKFIVYLVILIWVPGITTVFSGRLSPIIIFLLLLSIYLFLSNQDTTAGFLLALTAGSYAISGLIIILILGYGIVNRRWSVVSAFFSGFAFLVVVSLLLLPSWPGDWLRILFDNSLSFEFLQTPLMTLAAYLPGVENFLSIFLHVIFGIYFLYILISIKRKTYKVFIWNLLTTLVIAYLFNVRGSINYIFIIFPALFLVFRFLSERWGLFGKILSWLILFIFGVGSWLLILPLGSINFIQEIPLINIGVPILVLIGMNWIRWWAIKIPRFPFETL